MDLSAPGFTGLYLVSDPARPIEEVTMLTLEERFWLKVRKGAGCWEWTASLLGNRPNALYGNMYWKPGKRILAHRLSYMLHFGDIPNGMCVLHRCDNMRCVNPAHLSEWLAALEVRAGLGEHHDFLWLSR